MHVGRALMQTPLAIRTVGEVNTDCLGCFSMGFATAPEQRRAAHWSTEQAATTAMEIQLRVRWGSGRNA